MVKKPVANFFALLENDEVKKITLTQAVIEALRATFVDKGSKLITLSLVAFDGNADIEVDEVLYVEMKLPQAVTDATGNAISTPDLDISRDKIDALFWYEEGVFYFQNFDKRKLLSNRNVLVYSENTYSKLTEAAFIVDDIVNAVYKDGKLYFSSYANANKIFSLSEFYHEATDTEIVSFSTLAKVKVDPEWYKTNANSVVRKQITLLLKSKLLETAKPDEIRTSAAVFAVKIDVEGGKIVFPNNQKECRDMLFFLNEQYFNGVITGEKYKTNAKRKLNP